MTRLEIFVPGHPRTKGSFKITKNPKTSKRRPGNTQDTASWEADIKTFAYNAWGNSPLLSGPLYVECQFTFRRPNNHYVANDPTRPLKSNAPTWAATNRKWDGDKLVRAAWDAITGVVILDDGFIVKFSNSKVWGERPGMRIIVEEL